MRKSDIEIQIKSYLEDAMTLIRDLLKLIDDVDDHYLLASNEIENESNRMPDGSPKKPKITFIRSGKSVTWDESCHSILELAEKNGIRPNNSCRMGVCTTCETMLISGETSYSPEPHMIAKKGHVFICCSSPRTDLVIEA